VFLNTTSGSGNFPNISYSQTMTNLKRLKIMTFGVWSFFWAGVKKTVDIIIIIIIIILRELNRNLNYYTLIQLTNGV
jgi:hypothetical protein